MASCFRETLRQKYLNLLKKIYESPHAPVIIQNYSLNQICVLTRANLTVQLRKYKNMKMELENEMKELRKEKKDIIAKEKSWVRNTQKTNASNFKKLMKARMEEHIVVEVVPELVRIETELIIRQKDFSSRHSVILKTQKDLSSLNRFLDGINNGSQTVDVSWIFKKANSDFEDVRNEADEDREEFDKNQAENKATGISNVDPLQKQILDQLMNALTAEKEDSDEEEDDYDIKIQRPSAVIHETF